MKFLLLGTLFLLCILTSPQCTVPTVSTTGKGTVFGTPNMASFSVEISTTSPTSLESARTTNNKMSQVIQILNKNNILPRNIQTASLTISPRYNYSANVYPTPIIGQIASTSVNVKVVNISADGSSVGTLYDQLSNIDGVSIRSLTFDIENKTSLRSEARAQAYEQARQAARQFASFGGYSLGQPQLVKEQANEVRVNFGRVAYDNVVQTSALAAPSVSTAVAAGSYLIELSTEYTFFLI